MPRLSPLRALGAALLGASVALGGALALADGPRDKEGFAPDPPQHASTKQWVFDVAITHGVPSIAKARAVTLEHASETVRVVGRFAVELYVGPELVDRVRFDVPLMGVGPPDKSPTHPWPRPGFEDVNTHVSVQMADTPRAVYATLVDRQTKKTWRYEWPPEADGSLRPWIAPKYESADAAWPPPGSPPPIRDAGPDAAPHR
jgi:hypothetical protein